MMSLQKSPPVSLILLLLVGGAVAEYWGVYYHLKSVCALKGSTVTIGCSYTHQWNQSVKKAFWTKVWPSGGVEPPDLSDDPDYRGRVQYIGNKQYDCSLRLSDVTEKDQIKYYFTFTTNEGGTYQGADGVDLSVTDLQVEVSETLMEGDKVTLTCKTTCRPTYSPTFIWYRNEQPLSSSTEQLSLQKVSEDTGRYQCGLWGQNHRSPEVSLNVRYGKSVVLYAVLGAAAGGLSVVIVVLCLRRKRSAGDVNVRKNVDPNAQDDKCKAIQPMSRSSDVYNTINTF